MSHIGLLMTGVLTTGQPSLPKLPVQPLFQSDKPVQQSIEERSNDVVAATEITPPELIQLDGNLQVAHSPLNKEQQKILSSLTEKIKFIQSKFSHVGKDTAVEGWTLGEISVVAAVNLIIKEDEQSSDELVIARSRSVFKGESPKLRPKFINQNLPTLDFGSSGVSVKVLQRLLLSNGYAVRVDGVFGALTESAVKAFQNRRNLGVDGVVGSRTWRELTK
ncbi:peptidoglycan-binding domain 1 [Tolypothrix sp. NIES-4075]|uniref:peptidoglycan-binding domain-containing protein n=1 Tax=Tolypothrix sp. NIES-4075 TaxID=2005459 RepID=UPI000B5C87B7|nr:peptidoglycan-binding domain-containing protein [Tolypothrix sp. NIES-4075]GAX45109.1 peptidoglycan-binding domain 1 [Tolypothrix sp. NIES-4075]